MGGGIPRGCFVSTQLCTIMVVLLLLLLGCDKKCKKWKEDIKKMFEIEKTQET